MMHPVIPRAFEPVVSRLQEDLAKVTAGPPARVLPVAYEERPFSSVLRVRAIEPAGDACYFVKIYKSTQDPGNIEKIRARVSQDFVTTQRLARAMTTDPRLRVVDVIACYPDHLAIVTRQAVGDTLRAYLDRHASWFPGAGTRARLMAALSTVGEWIRAFQRLDPAGGVIEECELREYVDVRLKRLVQRGIYSGTRREAILAYLAGLGATMSHGDLARVLVHADMAPGNILIATDRVTVLDLAMVQRGAPLHDITRLYLQLDVLRAKPQFRPRVVAAIQRALLHGYDPGLSAAHPLFRYLVMLHRINHLSTLTLNRESFPASMVSRRVLQVHRSWIDSELCRPPAVPESC